jgi:tetratricopeptide (TPR) repeat protein
MVSGEAQVQLQQLEAAIQSYGLAIGAAPKSVAAFVQRAEALQLLRTFKSAEADYSAAISLSPSMSSLYMRRALVRENLGDLDGAINDMDVALDLEPESNRMLFARARLHQLANHREEYLKDFKSGMTATPKVVDDWVSRALAQLSRYPQKAKADLQEALRLDPDSVIALQNLAHLESEHLHDMKAAMTALNQILELSPDNETARAGRSVLLARQGLIEECLQDVDYLSKRETKLLPSTLYQMGCAHALIFKQNEDSGAIAVRLLAMAIRLGYGAEIIATDSDLDPIRGLASFVALSTISEYYKAN